MFEREVKFIYDFSTNKVKKLGAYISYSELKEVGIHPAILRYIAAEIEYRVFEDRQNLLTHSMFDYSSDTIIKYFALITEEIKKEKKFSAEFINKSILHASSFNINYLIRPNWALKKLIFDTGKSKSAAEIKQILNYAYYYDFVTKVIKDYINKKKLISLDGDEFDDLLKRIDRVSIETNLDDILDQTIEAMSNFFNIGSFNKNTVPLQGIGVFLKEKELTEQINSIQKALGDEAKPRIAKSDLKEILFGSGIEKTEYYEVEHGEQDEVEIEEVPEIEEEAAAEEEDIFSEELKSEPIDEEVSEPEANTEESIEEELPEAIEETTVPDEEDDEIIDVDIEEVLPEEIPAANEEPVEETAEWREAVPEDEEFEPEFEEEPEEKEDIGLNLMANKEKEVDESVPVEDEIKLEEEFPGEVFKDDENELVTEEESEEASEDEVIEEVEMEDAPQEEDENIEDDELVIEEEIEQFPEDEKEVSDNYNLEEATHEDETVPTDDSEETENPEDSLLVDDENLEADQEDSELNIEDDIETSEEEFVEFVKNDDGDDDEPSLFKDDEDNPLMDDDPAINEVEEEEFIKDYGKKSSRKRIDISDLLEKKDMTKIIQVVFDYDMEDFANTIEQVCDSEDKDEAFSKLDDVFDLNQVNPSSKEAQAFREIISEYFDQD